MEEKKQIPNRQVSEDFSVFFSNSGILIWNFTSCGESTGNPIPDLPSFWDAVTETEFRVRFGLLRDFHHPDRGEFVTLRLIFLAGIV